MNLLEVRDLKKHYPVQQSLFSRSPLVVKAVDGVSFDLNEGETLGLVGESGCGKTSLGRCIVRLIEPTSGSIKFAGRELLKMESHEMRSVRRHMQMIFQDPYGSLNPRMKISTILEEPMVIHRTGNKQDRMQRVKELMQMVGLDPSNMKRYPHEFSGGQRQRIGVARALALEPQLIIADEPVSALDVSVQAQIINLLKDLQQKLKLTFLFIAHDLSVVQHFSDRIGVMYLGKLVEICSSLELFRNPLHPYTKVLLDSIPVPDPEIKKQRVTLAGEIPSAANPPAGCRFHTRCAIAVDRCKVEEPVLREVQPGHLVACHLVQ
jgi:oligopeptide transport system ATP-binding protein